LNLILFSRREILDAGTVAIDDGRALHIRNVLKAGPGLPIQIGIIDGPRGLGTVRSVDGSSVTLDCAFEASRPSLPAVDLLLALPRPKVMKRLWAQLAAIGVGRILGVNAARVERQYFDTHVLSPECYRPLLIEGLQQVRDTRLPAVSIHRRLKVLVEDELGEPGDQAARLLADPTARNSVRSAVETSRAERCLLAVGPEGGWTDFEREMLHAHGFTSVGMRPRALRSDTACIALLTLVHEALADAGSR
jgi:RsmE family RNA methyltransferase